MGLGGPPLLFLGGADLPTVCLYIVRLSNTISIGSSDKEIV